MIPRRELRYEKNICSRNFRRKNYGKKGRSADFESVRPHSGIDCACEYFHWNNQSNAILLSASCFSYKPCEPRHHYRFDRRFRVLVRLGTTPLGRRGLVFSKILSLIILQFFQLAILSLVGLSLGWSPDPKWILAIPLCWLASCSFAGIALLIAGNVKAEANLGLQNLLFIILMGVGGIGFADSGELPDSLRNIVHIFPSGCFTLTSSILSWNRKLFSSCAN
jgi:ABC-type multidrug transport system permease subunit